MGQVLLAQKERQARRPSEQDDQYVLQCNVDDHALLVLSALKPLLGFLVIFLGYLGWGCSRTTRPGPRLDD